MSLFSFDDLKTPAHRTLRQEDRDRVILEELNHNGFTSRLPNVDDPGREEVWERCWNDCAINFFQNREPEDLIPPYFTDSQYINRFLGDYVTADDPQWLYHTWCALREQIFHKYLRDHPEIHEYGCGSGFNLVALNKLYPSKRLVGFDRSTAAVQLVSRVREVLEIDADLNGYGNDLTNPQLYTADYSTVAVCTFGALEQVGWNWVPFVEMMLRVKPALCLHVEPVLELYDESILFDWLAARYHRARGYLRGFLPGLRQLELQGKIDLVKVDRVKLGNRHTEGFSLIMWRPR